MLVGLGTLVLLGVVPAVDAGAAPAGVDSGPREVTLTAAGRTRELHGWSYDPGTGRLQVATGPVGAQAGAAVRLVYSR